MGIIINDDLKINSLLHNTKADKSKRKKVEENKKNKKSENSSDLKLSKEAKKLQQVDNILRNSLDKIREYDAVRENRLREVERRIEDGFYNREEFAEKLSKKLISDDEIKSEISSEKVIGSLIDDIKDIPQERTELSQEKLESIKERIANSFYDQPGVQEKLATNILRDLF